MESFPPTPRTVVGVNSIKLSDADGGLASNTMYYDKHTAPKLNATGYRHNCISYNNKIQQTKWYLLLLLFIYSIDLMLFIRVSVAFLKNSPFLSQRSIAKTTRFHNHKIVE